MRTTHTIVALMILSTVFTHVSSAAPEDVWAKAEENGEIARKTYIHCRDFVRGWLGHADPKSGLIPRNLNRDAFWNARDSAADNYPFMVLACSLLDEPMYQGRMREMLENERRLTSRVGAMPDDFLFATQSFRNPEIDMPSIIFGASEYMKDGLLPLTEWLGPSPWLDRMVELADEVLEHCDIETPVGPVPFKSHEVGGELMQVYSRLYWMSGKDAYRDIAFRYADYYLLHELPTEQEKLSLDDHGCEVIGGLSEVYLIAAKTDPERHAKYRAPMHAMLDRILEVGRNENGLFHMYVNPITGEVTREELTDNWGYDYNAYLTVAEIDDHEPYREAVRFVLEHVINDKDFKWEGGIADGYADSIESGLNLLNRIPNEKGFEWADYSTRIMLALQQDDGVVAGWHGDGNYTRTAIMYALWKSKGTHARPWRGDVAVGAELKDDELWVSIKSTWPWAGRLAFDTPRHKETFRLPMDYPRLNQFPEWFTVEKGATYEIKGLEETPKEFSGEQLARGIPVAVKRDEPLRLSIRGVQTQ